MVPDNGGFFTGSGVADTECDIDSEGFVTCTSAVQYGSALDCEGSPCPGLLDGLHLVTFESTDNLDHRELSPEYTWNSDTTSPTGSVVIDDLETDGEENDTLNDGVQISGTCDDDLFDIGGGEFATGSGCKEIDVSFDGFLTEPVYTFSIANGEWGPENITLPIDGWGPYTVTVQFRDNVLNDDNTASDDIFQNAKITITSVDQPELGPLWDLDDVTVSFDILNGRDNDQVQVFYSFDSIGVLPNEPVLTTGFPPDDLGDLVAVSASTVSPYPKDSFSSNDHTILVRILDFDDTVVFDFANLSVVDSVAGNVTVLKHVTETTVQVNPNPVAISTLLSPNMLVIGGDLEDLSLGGTIITAGVPNKVMELTGDGIVGGNAINEGAGITPADFPITGRFLVSDPTGVSISGGALQINNGAVLTFGILPTNINIRVVNDVRAGITITDGDGNSKTRILQQATPGHDAILQANDNQGIATISIDAILSGGPTIDLTTFTGDIMGVPIDPVELGDADISDINLVRVLGGEYKLEAFSPSDLTVGTPLDVCAEFLEDTNYLGSSACTDFLTNPNSETMGGLGLSTIVSDSGIVFTAIVCAAGEDEDADGICDDDEGGDGITSGIPFSAGGSSFFYPTPNTQLGRQDMAVEVLYMQGLQLEPEVLPAISTLFAANSKHIEFIERDLGFVESNTDVWINELTGFSNRNTSYDCIKADNYGLPDEQVDIDQASLVALSNQNAPKFWRTGDIFGVRITTPDTTTALNTGGITEGDIRIKFRLDTQAIPSFSFGPSADTPSPAAGLTLDSVTGDIEQIDTDLFDITVVVHYTATSPQTNIPIGAISYDLLFDQKKSAKVEQVHCDTTIFSSLLEARSAYWRTGIIVSDIGGSTGHGEFIGNDWTIAYDALPTDESTVLLQEIKWKSQAGTALHEVGHSLGLKHGAPAIDILTLVPFDDADINCQVTDAGVMPYSRQVPAPLGFLDVSDWRLDFSNGFLGSIDETSVSEILGRPFSTGPSPFPAITWGMPGGYADFAVAGIGSTPTLNINWNGDGDVSDTATLGTPFDTNNFGISGCGATPGDSYQDEDQWGNLIFIFTDTANGMDAGNFGPNTPHIDGGQEEPTIQLGAETQGAGATIKQWKMPISSDGSANIKKGKPGSNIAIKPIVQDSTGTALDSLVLTAFMSNKGAIPGDPVDNPVLCRQLDGTVSDIFTPPTALGKHYSCAMETPKSNGVYFLRIFSTVPDSEALPVLLQLTDTAHCLGQLEDNDPPACPSIDDLNDDNPTDAVLLRNTNQLERVSAVIVLGKEGTDPDPSDSSVIEVGNSSVFEGGPGDNTVMSFVLERSGILDGISSVDWNIVEGSATEGVDYDGVTSGTVTFVDGDFQEIVSINVIGDDDTGEGDETLTFVLTSPPVNAEIGPDGIGLGTILDDDDTVMVSIEASVSNAETDSGTKSWTFTVNRGGNLTGTATVDYHTTDGTGPDPATAPSDYDPVPIGTPITLTFNPGETSKIIQIQVNGDTTPEADETFEVILTNLSDTLNPSAIDNAVGVGTIQNDDAEDVSIASITPDSVPIGVFADDVVLLGDGFVDGAVVSIKMDSGKSPTISDVQFISSTEMRVDITVSDKGQKVTGGLVTVTNPDGGTATIPFSVTP